MIEYSFGGGTRSHDMVRALTLAKGTKISIYVDGDCIKQYDCTQSIREILAELFKRNPSWSQVGCRKFSLTQQLGHALFKARGDKRRLLICRTAMEHAITAANNHVPCKHEWKEVGRRAGRNHDLVKYRCDCGKVWRNTECKASTNG